MVEVAGFSELEEIGRGASAIVYRAQQVSVNRTVALKVLQSTLDADGLRRFKRECETVAALGWHPRVVAIHDAGTTAAGHPYLALEYLPNGSLGTRLRETGPLSPQDVTAFGIQIADALDAAHRQGIVHRDVKPGNVLVSRIGDAKLADFGIVALDGSNTSVTGSLSGTLAYMAPELFEGERATPSTDIYALGASMFTLLTGRVPFEAATPIAIIGQVAHQSVPDLRESGVPDELASAIEWAMAKTPGQRPADAAEFTTILQAVAATEGWPPEPTYTDRDSIPPVSPPVPNLAAPSPGKEDATIARAPGRPATAGAVAASAQTGVPDAKAPFADINQPTATRGRFVSETERPLADNPAEADHRQGRGLSWRLLREHRFAFAAVLLLAVIGVAIGAVAWTTNSTYFVTFEGDQVVAYRGKPGGVLWFDPKLQDTTKITRDEVPPALRPTIAKGKEFSSRPDADRYLINLQAQVDDATAPTATTSTTKSGSTTTRTSEPAGPKQAGAPWAANSTVPATGLNAAFAQRGDAFEDPGPCRMLGVDPSIWSPEDPSSFGFDGIVDYGASGDTFTSTGGEYEFTDGSALYRAGYGNDSFETWSLEMPTDDPAEACSYRLASLEEMPNPELMLTALRFIE